MDYYSNNTNSWHIYEGNSLSALNLKTDYKDLIPTRIIFNNRSTVCFWKDGTKTVVTCAPGDTFSEEEGVAQCIVRKIFDGNRSAFLRIVEKAYRQPNKDEVKK